MRVQYGTTRALDLLIVTLVPSIGGDRVIEGGFGPAPSKVIVGDWRA